MEHKKYFIAAIVIFILAAGLYYSMTYQAEEKEDLFFAEDLSSNNPDSQKNKNEDEENKQLEDQSEKKDDIQAESVDTNEICVYVCGNVKRPGVYYLLMGNRISDAVDMAGGLTKKAAKEYINLAKELTDGERIYIPSKDELEDSNIAQNAQLDKLENRQSFDRQESEGEQPKVNINQAGPSDLLSLPGIGEAKANAIIKYREEQGLFRQVEDIKQIEGIKDGVFNKIKDLIEI